MEITEEIRRSHERLSTESVKFLEYVKENPIGLEHSHFASLKWPDPTVKFQPWPAFISRDTRNEFKEVAVKVLNLIKSIPRRFFSYDPEKISAYYEIEPDMVRYYLAGVTEEHLNSLVARGDFVFSPSGFTCVEFNIASNIAGWELPFWESMYLKVPVIKSFLEKYNIKIGNRNVLSVLLEYLVDRVRERFSIGSAEINIAFVLPKYGDPDAPNPRKTYIRQLYKTILARKGLDPNGEVVLCDFAHLDIAGGGITFRGRRVYLILEYYGGTVPPLILGVFGKGNVLVYNGNVSDLMANKTNLALLSENEGSDIFSPRERETIKKHIPWSRRMIDAETTYADEKIKLVDFVLAHRERLVLKPARQLGGKGVCIGRNMVPQKWQFQVEQAVKGKEWVVQEYVPSSRYLFQAGEKGAAEHDAIWGILVFGSRYGGGWLRVLPSAHSKGVINRAQGARESVILEVDDQT